MATYLFTWELGYGLGHLVNLRPLVEKLAERGHRVVLVLRDLSQAGSIFSLDRVTCWQAPFKQRRTQHLGPTLSLSHILYENGFCDAVELGTLAGAWRNIFQAVDPDVIVFDHSPTGLLAARGLRAKRVTLGTGFFLPPDQSPLPCVQPWLNPDQAQLVRDDEQVASAANQVLRAWGEPPLARLASLYHPSDEHLLVTFPELDHYGQRPGVRYWGSWTGSFGKVPEWPGVPGKKIYAYLKQFPQLPTLLAAIGRSGNPAIVFGSEIPETMRQQFACRSLRFSSEPLDIERAASECDVAILNANHGTAVSILRAGKPSLQIPIYVEQSLLAMAIVRMGAGLAAPPDQGGEIEQEFQRLLHDESCAPGARRFADRHASFDAKRAIDEIVVRLEELGRKH